MFPFVTSAKHHGIKYELVEGYHGLTVNKAATEAECKLHIVEFAMFFWETASMRRCRAILLDLSDSP